MQVMKKLLLLLTLAVICSCSGQVDPASYESSNPTNMQRAINFIQECGNYYLATADKDQPRVRPFGTFIPYEGKVYIVTSNTKKTYKQLSDNQEAEICGLKSDRSFIRITATLQEDTRMKAKEDILELAPHLKGRYSADDGILAIFFLKDASVRECTMSGENEVDYEF